jgi:hypothetical protein
MVAPDGRWHPGIGDPTLLGWVTVVGYFGAALLAYRAFRLHQAAAPSKERRLLLWFWAVVLCAMVLLGVNKQLDLQTWLTQMGRDLAQAEGWYQRRQEFQVAFISVIAVMGVVGLLNAALMLRSLWWRVAGALLGLGFLITFVVVRAASLHRVDALLGYGTIRLNWVLELGGIALVAASASRQGRKKEA